METSSGTPPWPLVDPRYEDVFLRRFRDEDTEMAMALARDEYVPTIGTLPGHASQEEALAWVERQRQRHNEGTGFSFSIADAGTGRSVGQMGLWTRELHLGRAQAGYGVMPGERGRGIAAKALQALLGFAWTIPGLHRVELHIEPWNTASIRSADRAEFQREGLLRGYQEIGGERRDMLLYTAVRATPTVSGIAANSPSVLRSATIGDIPGIRRFGEDIRAQYAPLIGAGAADGQVQNWWNEASIRAAVAEGLVVVAEQDGRLTGVGQRGHRGADHVIYKLYVHPEDRGHGLGRRLLDALIEELPANAHRLYIEHFTANKRAAAFYEREGFTVERIEPNPTGTSALPVVWRARDLDAHR
ncbi:GNAT family N-acetyltransferase [Arthrobacter sp. Hz1]